MLEISSASVMRLCPSRWSRLSVPKPRFRSWRGLTRSGLWSGLPVPAAGRVSSAEVTALLQDVMGLATVARVPPQARPIVTCWLGVSSLIANAADHQTAVITQRHRYPFGVVRPLITGIEGRLKRLIVIDAENTIAQVG